MTYYDGLKISLLLGILIYLCEKTYYENVEDNSYTK